MEETAKIWMDDAKYDIQSVEVMLKAGRYFYVVFMCHLAIEKMLKALWVEQKNETPPKVHNLLYLSESVVAEKMPEHLAALIDDLHDKSVITRYPEERKKIAKRLTKKRATEILASTKELKKWLKKRLA